ncbi:hypothetical protein GXM_05348 [Nostoc sphaeroides CCNUC1]|uniref:Uncharacterized protein n=1 Tax=Nostoc sphaeroides CCNUC1 TaxID=2653204 RepID=A0A5P8W6H2_9NOSO|nr:hypothetical protein GXM_05348 [Nostoc sphaeroides CCNUC1]
MKVIASLELKRLNILLLSLLFIVGKLYSSMSLLKNYVTEY